jgi:hypothetical protein
VGDPERLAVPAAEDYRRAASKAISLAAPDRDGCHIAVGDLERARALQVQPLRPELEPARLG